MKVETGGHCNTLRYFYRPTQGLLCGNRFRVKQDHWASVRRARAFSRYGN
jgi:hypothetical protein